MSNDFKQTEAYAANENMAQPQSSGSSKWIIGGCGCLFLVLAVCGVGGYLGWAYLVKPTTDFIFESQEMATSNQVIVETLGDDVRVSGPMTQTTQDRDITMRFPVSGSKGAGVFVTTGTMQDDLKWERTQSYLEFEGEEISLDEDAGLDLQIE